jgi:hypothetical protein
MAFKAYIVGFKKEKIRIKVLVAIIMEILE